MRDFVFIKQTLLKTIDSIDAYLGDHTEIVLTLCALLLIIAVCRWVIFARLGVKGWKSLIPIYSGFVIFRAVGMRPFLSFFLLIPLTNIPIFIAFIFRLLKVYKRSYFFIIGLLLLPLVFICILAFGEGHTDHSKQRHAKLSDTPSEEQKPKLTKKQLRAQAKQTKRAKLSERKRQKKLQKQLKHQKLTSKRAPGFEPKVTLPVTPEPEPIVARPFRDIVAQPKPSRPPQRKKKAMDFVAVPKHPRRPEIAPKPVQSQPRGNKGVMEFKSVPKNYRKPIESTEEKKLVSTGVSIDMVKHNPKKKTNIEIQ